MGCCSSSDKSASNHNTPDEVQEINAAERERLANKQLIGAAEGEDDSTRPGTAFSLALNSQQIADNALAAPQRSSTPSDRRGSNAGTLPKPAPLEVFAEDHPGSLNITPTDQQKKTTTGKSAISSQFEKFEIRTPSHLKKDTRTGDVHRLLQRAAVDDFDDDADAEVYGDVEDPENVEEDDDDDDDGDLGGTKTFGGSYGFNPAGSLRGGVFGALQDEDDDDDDDDDEGVPMNMGLSIMGKSMKSEDFKRVELEATKHIIRDRDENRPIRGLIPFEDGKAKKKRRRRRGPKAVVDAQGKKRQPNKPALMPMKHKAQPHKETKSSIERARAQQIQHKATLKQLRKTFGARDKATHGKASDEGKAAVRSVCRLVAQYAALGVSGDDVVVQAART